MKIQNHKLAAHESLITQKPSHPTFLFSAQMSVRASTSTPSDGGSVNLKFLPAQIVFLVFERCPLAPPPPPERPSSEVVADEEHRRLFISRGCGALVPACLLGFHRRLTYHYLICLVRALHDGPPPLRFQRRCFQSTRLFYFCYILTSTPTSLKRKPPWVPGGRLQRDALPPAFCSSPTPAAANSPLRGCCSSLAGGTSSECRLLSRGSVKLRGFPPWVAIGISLCIATGNGTLRCAGRVYTAPAIIDPPPGLGSTKTASSVGQRENSSFCQKLAGKFQSKL